MADKHSRGLWTIFEQHGVCWDEPEGFELELIFSATQQQITFNILNIDKNTLWDW